MDLAERFWICRAQQTGQRYTLPMKRGSAQNLSDVVQKSPVLAELSGRIAVMAAVQNTLQARWPALDCRVLSMRDGVLNLSMRSAALAAKARQLEPSMLGAVQRVNPTIRSIRFRPAKNDGTVRLAQAHSTRERQIADDALESLQFAASEMNPGPLRLALERMIRRQLSQR